MVASQAAAALLANSSGTGGAAFSVSAGSSGAAAGVGGVRSEETAVLNERDNHTPWPAVLGVFVAIVAFTWALLAMAL